MWFQAEISKNPEFLENLVDEDDVMRIAEIIKAQDDEYICSRISFELALGGQSGEDPCESPTRVPLITVCFDVLDEKYLLDKRDTKIKSDLENLVKNLNEVGRLINREDIADILIHSDQFTEHDLQLLKKLVCAEGNKTFAPLHDVNKYKKRQHKSWGETWGKLGYYKIYLEKVTELYTELSGKEFASDFVKDHGNKWQPASEGTRFLYEFHKILNHLSEKYGGKPFTDKNFKNSCNEIRTKIHSLRKIEI